MRHPPHAPGSEAAQSTLQAIAGWAPTRRSVISTLLTVSAAATAVTAGASIAALPALAEQEASSTDVSPRMASLVAEFERTAVALDEMDPNSDPAAWQAAVVTRATALSALVLERPATLEEFVSKFEVVVAFLDAEREVDFLTLLVDDAAILAGKSEQ
jgi:hypothetical protein